MGAKIGGILVLAVFAGAAGVSEGDAIEAAWNIGAQYSRDHGGPTFDTIT